MRALLRTSTSSAYSDSKDEFELLHETARRLSACNHAEYLPLIVKRLTTLPPALSDQGDEDDFEMCRAVVKRCAPYCQDKPKVEEDDGETVEGDVVNDEDEEGGIMDSSFVLIFPQCIIVVVICNNLNFARRDHCNNCKRHRFAPPRRGYLGPPPPLRRFPGPPLVNRSPPGRAMNGGFRSPPRGWARDSPREFGVGVGPPPHPRYEGRFPDDHMRRDRLDYPPEDHRGERSKFDRPLPPLDLGNRDRGSGRDHFFSDRKGYERRPLSPPLLPPSLRSPPLPSSLPLPPRGRWERDVRERSRSPIRGGPPPPKDYRRDMYAERGRDEPRGMGRDRINDVY
ncbi:hypothetical protein C3L33_03627, partial [Rhododendron williamsianum]